MESLKISPINQLAKIQRELKAPKGQYNSFGKYKYRSCEDILEAVKPLLGDLILTISDEMLNIGDRYYVKAVATISNGKDIITATSYAREPENKKGMDESQITGTASSYARKYALNGLFLIDDTKDADTDEHRNRTNDISENKPKKLITTLEEAKEHLKSSISQKQLYYRFKNEIGSFNKDEEIINFCKDLKTNLK